MHDRLTRSTYELIINKTYNYSTKMKFRETLAAAQLKDPNEHFANKWLRNINETIPVSKEKSIISSIPDEDLLTSVVDGALDWPLDDNLFFSKVSQGN